MIVIHYVQELTVLLHPLSIVTLLQLYLDVCDHFDSLISHSVPVCLFLCHLCSALVANKVLLLQLLYYYYYIVNMRLSGTVIEIWRLKVHVHKQTNKQTERLNDQFLNLLQRLLRSP